MKKLFKSMLLAGVICAAMGLAACSDDDDNTTARSEVEYVKTHDTAILLVTFGSTWNDPHETYEKQISQFKSAFPNADIFFSFTSKTCINRWYAATGEFFVTPDKWLTSFLEKNYKNVYVQSLHVIPGEEFMLLRDSYVKPYYNFVAEEMGRTPAALGEALLQSEQDQKEVAKVLVDHFAAELQAGDAVAFMGHGNPISDYNHANASYEHIEKYMQEYAGATYNNANVFVGTVDYPQMLIDYVKGELNASTCTTKKVHLHPLMSIAGDHANNDMSGDYDPEAAADEQSWKVQIEAMGWTVECQRRGLGDYPEINKVWIRHLNEAIAALDEK